MAKVIKREVYYFDEPGERNTQLVLAAVSHRLEAGGIRKMIIASTAGETPPNLPVSSRIRLN